MEALTLMRCFKGAGKVGAHSKFCTIIDRSSFLVCIDQSGAISRAKACSAPLSPGVRPNIPV